MKYDVVIGIEVHAELKSKQKLFSPALNSYGKAVNEFTSLIDTAQPGTLPVLNKKCLELALTAALALNCDITKYMEFDRKNYFYPDIPKGYQITQDRTPIGKNGKIEFEIDDEKFCVGVTRLHIEEDTLLDFNRSGSPLIEIVSDPTIYSPKQASKYISTLRSILMFAGVSDVRMEEGSMRCDVNISLKLKGVEQLGTKVEIKNLNSISKIEKSLEFEIERQAKVLDKGETVIQETRRFDDLTGETVVMRVKEASDDYRYHYDPNIPPVVLTDEYIKEVESQIPELPKDKRKRYIETYNLSDYDAHVLTLNKETSDFFDDVVKLGASPKKVANYIMGDISSYMNKHKLEFYEISLTAVNLYDILVLLDNGDISSKIAKQLINVCLEEVTDVKDYVKENDLVQISDDSELDSIVKTVISENTKSVEYYKNGNKYAFKHLVGQVMKLSKGKANPQKVVAKLESELE